MNSGDERSGTVSVKCRGLTIIIKSGEVTSDYIEDSKVVQGTTSLWCQYEPTSLTMLSGTELATSPTPIVITDPEDAELGALRKLKERVMEVRTS